MILGKVVLAIAESVCSAGRQRCHHDQDVTTLTSISSSRSGREERRTAYPSWPGIAGRAVYVALRVHREVPRARGWGPRLTSPSAPPGERGGRVVTLGTGAGQ